MFIVHPSPPLILQAGRGQKGEIWSRFSTRVALKHSSFPDEATHRISGTCVKVFVGYTYIQIDRQTDTTDYHSASRVLIKLRVAAATVERLGLYTVKLLIFCYCEIRKHIHETCAPILLLL